MRFSNYLRNLSLFVVAQFIAPVVLNTGDMRVEMISRAQ